MTGLKLSLDICIALLSITVLVFSNHRAYDFGLHLRLNVRFSALPTGDEDIHIHGKVSFKKSPGKLPMHSCLRVVFEDVLIQDDASVVYKAEEFNVTNADINTHYEYKFTTKKPKDVHEFYAVSAVLNVGWCPDPDSDDWIRDFDFLSDTTIYVPITENVTDYEVDVPVVFYCKCLHC